MDYGKCCKFIIQLSTKGNFRYENGVKQKLTTNVLDTARKISLLIRALFSIITMNNPDLVLFLGKTLVGL